MPTPTTSQIIQTSIITAFTIAAALIWKDVIVEFIELLVPPPTGLIYKFIAAVIATLLVVIAIYALLKTESEAEKVIKEIKKRNNKRNNNRNNQRDKT